MLHFTPYLLPFIISALAGFVLAWFTWRLRHNVAAFFLLLVIACLEIWTVGFIFEIAADSLDVKLFLANIQFIGIDSLPVVWLALTLTYSGHFQRWKGLVKWLTLVPVISQLVIWTDPLHHLFRTSPRLDTTTASFAILVNDYSIWYYYIQMPFVNLIFLATTILLIYTLRFTTGTHHKQIFLILLSTVLPLVFNGLYVLNLSPIPHLNLSSVGFSVSSLLLTWNLLRYQFLDLMPVARSILVDTLKDAWLVIDYAGRFVDLNQAAQQIIVRPKAKIIGWPVEEVLADKPELVAFLKADATSQREIKVKVGSTTRYYDLSLTVLTDEWAEISGRLVVLRDISERVQVEQEREQLILKLQEALAEVKLLSGLLPICANCKNVRDDQGYWHQVEAYVEEHSEVKFSHGICPTCLHKQYPEIAQEILNRMQNR